MFFCLDSARQRIKQCGLWVVLVMSPTLYADDFFARIQAVKLDNSQFDQQGKVKTEGDIDRKTVCLRPMRKGLPNISTEMVKGQLRVHLYGHGGSGWTLLWGSINKAMALFSEEVRNNKLGSDTAITVVGAGVMGSVMALSLYDAGYKNIQIVAAKDDGIASYNSTGYLAMVSLATESKEEDEFVKQLAMESLEGFKKVDQGIHPLVNEGVRLVDVYSGLGKPGDIGPLETYTGIEPFADAGLLPPPEDGIVEFSTGQRYPMRRFKTYFMDTVVLMEAFERMLKEKQIPRIDKTINSFDEIDSRVLINASGLGSVKLNEDDKVYPNMGLLLELDDQPLEQLNYIVYTRYQPAGEPLRNGPKDKADIYFMPRKGGLLGATFIDHNDGTDSELNEKLFSRILKENKRFFGY